MRKILYLIILLVAVVPANLFARKKSDIKVLIVAHNSDKVYIGGYAGPKASPRQNRLARTRGKEWKNLLSEYFKTVDIITSDKYKSSDSEKYDVTILDDLPEPIETADFGKYRRGKSIIRGGKPMMYPRYLPVDFRGAIISIGDITDNLTYMIPSDFLTR